MRPPAPWHIFDVDLAHHKGAFDPGIDRPTLVILRRHGAVLGRAHLMPNELPMTAAEFAEFAAQHCAEAVRHSLRLGLVDDRPWPRLKRPPSETPLLGADCLARLDDVITERRARPVTLSASIVICTRQRPQDLAACLEAIAAEIAAGREVIVVDNGPDAETRAAAEAANVRYVVEPRPGLSRARNAGVIAATGDVVIFVDDDVRPEPGWADALMCRFDADHVGLVCGLVLPDKLETPAQIGFEYELGFGGMGLLPLRFDGEFRAAWRKGVPVWDIGAGANMAIRRRRVIELGGFDERIGPGAAGGCGDDSEFWHRLIFAGDSAIYEPLSVVRHRHRRDWAALEHQARGYSFGHIVALFVQYARDGDRGDLVRAFLVFPYQLLRRAARAPLKRLRNQPDRLVGAWIRGYLASLRHISLLRAAPDPLSNLKRTRDDG